MDLLSLFNEAVSKPSLPTLVKWPKDLAGPELYVRLWPNNIYQMFVEKEKQESPTFVTDTWWWCVVVSICDKDGNLVFVPSLLRTTNDHSSPMGATKPLSLLDIPTFEEASVLKDTYGHPQAKKYFEALWEVAMAHNGFIAVKDAAAAKN